MGTNGYPTRSSLAMLVFGTVGAWISKISGTKERQSPAIKFIPLGQRNCMSLSRLFLTFTCNGRVDRQMFAEKKKTCPNFYRWTARCLLPLSRDPHLLNVAIRNWYAICSKLIHRYDCHWYSDLDTHSDAQEHKIVFTHNEPPREREKKKRKSRSSVAHIGVSGKRKKILVERESQE